MYNYYNIVLNNDSGTIIGGLLHEDKTEHAVLAMYNDHVRLNGLLESSESFGLLHQLIIQSVEFNNNLALLHSAVSKITLEKSRIDETLKSLKGVPIEFIAQALFRANASISVERPMLSFTHFNNMHYCNNKENK